MESSGIVFRIDEDMKVKFSMIADLDRCPAFRFDRAWQEGWNLDPIGAAGSDIPDCLHLSGIAYCDVAFADKRTIAALQRGRSPRLPRKNAEFSSWVGDLA